MTICFTFDLFAVSHQHLISATWSAPTLLPNTRVEIVVGQMNYPCFTHIDSHFQAWVRGLECKDSRFIWGVLIPSKSPPSGCDKGGTCFLCGLLDGEYAVVWWLYVGSAAVLWLLDFWKLFSYSLLLLFSHHILSLFLRLPFTIYFVAPCECLAHLIQSTDLARSRFIPSPVQDALGMSWPTALRHLQPDFPGPSTGEYPDLCSSNKEQLLRIQQVLTDLSAPGFGLEASHCLLLLHLEQFIPLSFLLGPDQEWEHDHAHHYLM